MTPRGRRQLLIGSAAALASAAVPARAGQGLRLSLNENAFGPSPRVAEAIEAELVRLNRYVETDEADALRAQIAALEQVSPDQVVLGEVLEPLGVHLGARSFLGGDVVYSTPGYTALVDSGAPFGLAGQGVPLNAALENDLPALARAIGRRTVAVSLVNPHNPSGTVSDIAALDAFITDAAQHTLVIVDEAYLEYDARFADRSAIRHVRKGANVLVFRTLAKVYGLAGLAMGYAVAPKPLAGELRAVGIGTPHSLDRLSLAAARAALTDQAYVRTVRDRVAGERERLHAALDGRGIRRSDSHANFVFFAPSDPEALRKRFSEADIQIARAFPPLDRWIRVTIGTPAEVQRVINVLSA